MKRISFEKYISINPEIMHGKPCIKGTRIPVSLVIGMLGDGMPEDEVLRQYPSLTKSSILASLKYASRMCEFESATA